jgi:4-hydroxybenzoate polyprenyltransferase
VGAWAAVTGKLPWQSWALGGAVAAWVAGFDCFYALFDLGVDRAQGLHSVAVRFGERGAFVGARILHVVTVGALVVAGIGIKAAGWGYWIGVAIVALLLGYEHSLVRPGDLRRLDAAFFTTNGVISVAFFAFVLLGAIA